jgi:hypothetical protein
VLKARSACVQIADDFEYIDTLVFEINPYSSRFTCNGLEIHLSSTARRLDLLISTAFVESGALTLAWRV